MSQLLITQAASLYYRLEGTGGTGQVSHWTGLAGGFVAPQMTVGVSASVSPMLCFLLQLGSSREERPCTTCVIDSLQKTSS